MSKPKVDVDPRATCDGHMMSGRKAVVALDVAGQRTNLCEECVADAVDALKDHARRPTPVVISDEAPKDFRPLDSVPPKVRP